MDDNDLRHANIPTQAKTGLEWATRPSSGKTAVSFGLFKIWFGRGTNGIKPAADVDLRVGFSAVMTSSCRFGDLGTPAVNRKIGISAVNHKPVQWIGGHDTADFATEFLQCRHEFVPCRSRVRLASHCKVARVWRGGCAG